MTDSFHSSFCRHQLGIAAAVPFSVVTELGPPTLQRGALHVYIPRCVLVAVKIVNYISP